MSVDFESDEFLMAAISYLIVHRRASGYKQVDIARDVRARFPKVPELQQSKVSKLIKSAIEKKYLVKTFGLGPNISKEIRQFVEDEFQSDPKLQELVDANSPHPFRCKVHVCTGPLEDYPHEAAWKLTKILEPAKLVAVSWGRTLADVLKALDELTFAPNWAFEAFPIVGQPLHLRDDESETRFDAFHLAEQLLQFTASDPAMKRHMPLLNGVPAYIASKFKRNEIRAFINEIPGYAEIFGSSQDGSTPLSARMCALLTGVGLVGENVSDDDTAVFIRERLKQEPKLKCDRLKKWIYGDISGWLLAKPTSGAEEKIADYNDGWVGLDDETLRQCSERASKNNLPGIVIFAYQPEKAEIVARVVAKGWVNNLVIHKGLAEALEKELG